jgi:hypothetical protein
MILEFVVIFIFLTLIGFPIISLLYPSANIVFKLGCAAYFASLVIIACASVSLRIGLNINYCIIPFILISFTAWYFIFKKNAKNLAYLNKVFFIKTVLIMGFIVCISSFILIYPSFMRAYGMYHARPDFYGYGIVASYLEDKNTIPDLKQTAEHITNHWELGDFREAVSIEFIIGSNRYGIQSLAAVLDNLIFRSNSAVKLLYPLVAISLIAVLSSVYQIIFTHKLKITYVLFAVLLVGLNINNLVSIVEGNLPSVFSLAIPLLLYITISSLVVSKKQKKQIVWTAVLAIVILLSSSLIIYQEVTEVMFIFLIAIFIFSIIIKDKKRMLNLTIAGIIFFIINFDILTNILPLIVQFRVNFLGSYDTGFLNIINALGLNQPYCIIPHVAPVVEQSRLNSVETLLIYLILGIATFIYYKLRKIPGTIFIVIFLGIICFGIVIFENIFKSNYVIWKLTYALFPFIVISLVLFIRNIQLYFDKIANEYFTRVFIK